MRGGHIETVKILTAANDEDRIAESRELFKARPKPSLVDGFEVWDGPRFLYRYPEAPKT
jgi:hypothetical protein